MLREAEKNELAPTLLGVRQGIGTQHRYEAPGDLWVKN